IGHAHGQPRGCGERSRAGPKRALRVQSVSVPVAAELRLPPVGLRLWTELLQLRAKLLQLCTKLLRLRTRLVRRLVWRRSIGPRVVVRRAIVCSGLRLSPKPAAARQGADVPASARARVQSCGLDVPPLFVPFIPY